MAYFDTSWYCNAGDQSTTGHYAVTKWAATTVIAAGALRRQLAAPTVGNERVFIAIVGGTTGGSEPAWVLTRGAKTTDNTVTWIEVTGISAVNGDKINTQNWTALKAAGTPSLGGIIQRNNGASYWICSTAGALGASEPAWPNDTAGTTQADSTTTWTCLGVVGNFTGGQAPHARLANVFGTNWFAAGNTVYVGDNHAKSQTTAITLSPTGSNSAIDRILSHNHSGSYPPASTDLMPGATISTTAAANISFNPAGSFYLYGITLKAGVGSAGVALIFLNPNGWAYFDACSFWLSTTSGINIYLQIGLPGAAAIAYVVFNNSTVKFAHTAQYINPWFVQFVWQNCGTILASGSSVPASLLSQSSTSGNSNTIVFEALDLSQLTGSLQSFSNSSVGNLLVKDCKLNASATISTPINSGVTVQMVRSDSGGTAYKSTRYQYEGTETTETSITRVGGATDPTGQAQSRKIITTANSQWLRPFKAEPYAIWNPTTGANVTVTVYGTINTGALPNNDDIWLEVEYLGSSASPLGTIVSTTKSNLLAANAAVASDSSTWGTPHTQFDGANTLVALSNSNLTVTHNVTTTNAGAISTTFLSAGKYYFEIALPTVTNTANGNLGLMSSDWNSSFTSSQCTTAAHALAVSTGTVSLIYSNGASTGINLGTNATGDVYSFAVDLTARLGWVRKNGGNWNGSGTANPVTGVGGVTLAAGFSFAPIVQFLSTGSTGDTMTANFGQSTYAYTAPSGFLSWDTGWTPFKLTTTLSSPQLGMAGYLEARVRAAKPSTTYYLDPQISLS